MERVSLWTSEPSVTRAMMLAKGWSCVSSARDGMVYRLTFERRWRP